MAISQINGIFTRWTNLAEGSIAIGATVNSELTGFSGSATFLRKGNCIKMLYDFGLMTRPAVNDITKIFSIPKDYLPSTQLVFLIQNTLGSTYFLRINPDGTSTIQTMYTTPNDTSGSWLVGNIDWTV